MTDFHHARYRDTQRIFLDQVAYAARMAETWAEERGGAQSLTDADRKSYQGRKRRLIQLAQFNDAAEAYIDALLETIEQMTAEKRQLATQLRDLTGDGDLAGHWRERRWRSGQQRADWILSMITLNPSRAPLDLSHLLNRKQAIRRATIERDYLTQPSHQPSPDLILSHVAI